MPKLSITFLKRLGAAMGFRKREELVTIFPHPDGKHTVPWKPRPDYNKGPSPWPDSVAIVTHQDGKVTTWPHAKHTPSGGRCTAARCTCIGPPRSTLRMFCESWDCTRPAGEHERQAVEKWFSLPEALRTMALDHLRRTIVPRHQPALDKWRKQFAAGQALGSDDIRFHFAGGMAVRNVLRQVVPDHKLPETREIRGGDLCVEPGNWDDFYYGAIYELAEETLDQGEWA